MKKNIKQECSTLKKNQLFQNSEHFKISEKYLIDYNLFIVELINTVWVSILEAEKKQDFRLLKKKLKSYFSNDKLMEKLKFYFYELYPEFSNNLSCHYPNLTSKEIDFLILVKINMCNREIAKFLNFNNKSVVSKKYIIRKKMKLKNNEELNNLIINI